MNAIDTAVSAPAYDTDHVDALDGAVAEIVQRYGEAAHEPAGRRKLWDALEQGGFTLLSVPEESGGSGGSLADAAVVLRRCAYAGVRLPLVSTLLGAWSCAWAGAEIPSGPLAFTWSTARPGEPVRLPWAPFADWLVLLKPSELVVADRSAGAVRELADGPFTGEPLGESDTLAGLPGMRFRSLPTAEQALLRGALLRSAELHGAAASALDQAAGYAGEREQFGRALHRFQAVAHLLAQCAGEVVATGVAVDTAIAVADDVSAPERAEAAALVAKIQASATAGRIAAATHQVHGAIGFTEEHPLHISTRALWQWRDDYGDEHHWAARLSGLAERHGRKLWELLAD
ncbi:acyl-CoA dehydrogenase family protein [Streptomyces sp. NPDC056817]|uniref:acyl-CoA dehydrogenase family protein n=1 Tax=Streptomyces sp. NPDC056817 TaxID=3345950 RepID=UPI0036878147